VGLRRLVLMRYSFARHLVYSLLRGRPVLVVGSSRHEPAVRALVMALAVFVPIAGVAGDEHETSGVTAKSTTISTDEGGGVGGGGGGGSSSSSSNSSATGSDVRMPAVVPWRGIGSPPLRLVDLATLRLAGVASEQHAALASAVDAYVSVLDFDEQTLLAPVYASTSGSDISSSNSSGGVGAGASGSHRGTPRRATTPAAAAAAAAMAPVSALGGVPAAGAGLLDELLAPRRHWRSEQCVLAFVHRALHQLAIKAFLYYHVCCLGSATGNATRADESVARGMSTAAYPPASPPSTPSTSMVSPYASPTTAHSASQQQARRISRQLMGVGGGGAGALAFSSTLSSPGGAPDASVGSSDEYRDAEGSLRGIAPPLTRDTFFRRAGVPACDVGVVTHLAELVLLRVTATSAAAPIVRLDFAPRHLFVNSSSDKQS
jgi:hypothetical protein